MKSNYMPHSYLAVNAKYNENSVITSAAGSITVASFNLYLLCVGTQTRSQITCQITTNDYVICMILNEHHYIYMPYFKYLSRK